MRAAVVATLAFVSQFVSAPAVVGQIFVPYSSPQPLPCHVEWFHHPSTAYESYATGIARGLRAVGEMNYLQSLAAVNYQQAQSQYLACRERKMAAASVRREAEQLKRTARRERLREKYQEWRHRCEEEAIALRQSLQSTGGRIDWPAALQKPQFEARLAAIEQAATCWLKQSYTLDSNDRRAIARTIKETKRLVNRDGVNTSSDERNAALKLLCKIELVLTSSQPAAGLVANAN